MAEKILATLRNEPGAKIDFLVAEEGKDVYFILGAVGYRSEYQTIHLEKHEFIALMKAGLEYLKVDVNLVEAVIPKLTKANIVR